MQEEESPSGIRMVDANLNLLPQNGSVNGPVGSRAGALDQMQEGIQTLRGQICQRTGVTTNAREKKQRVKQKLIPFLV